MNSPKTDNVHSFGAANQLNGDADIQSAPNLLGLSFQIGGGGKLRRPKFLLHDVGNADKARAGDGGLKPIGVALDGPLPRQRRRRRVGHGVAAALRDLRNDKGAHIPEREQPVTAAPRRMSRMWQRGAHRWRALKSYGHWR